MEGGIVRAQHLDAYREALLEEADTCGDVVQLLEVENLSISELVHTAADMAITALEKCAGE